MEVRNNPVETSDLLSKEDEILLAQIERIKKNITKFIKPEVLIEKIKGFIEESPAFDFKSKRNAKYINTKKPLFILTLNRKAITTYEFIYKEGEEVDGRAELVRDYDFINECLHETVISKVSDFISKKLKNNEEFMKVLDDNDIEWRKLSKSQMVLMGFLTASIFGITVDLKNNTIYLEYVV